MDSQFHADRLQTAAKLPDGNMDQILALGGVDSSRTIRLVGADTFPLVSDLARYPPEVIISVGIYNILCGSSYFDAYTHD